ncbi:DUF7007 domain-containing protein [Rathayibacter tritici]|uniref:DUF7007 domain-containing protein n=1 Tax=Rathayibacter tritici TaxID=33888 RepID=A0A160KRK3_9MICO|nr:hypothetical protein [Rathayibacter tritici]AND15919.1 hypothetical protein A6122_0766 [Rathayibacter tritici]PPI41081.1 hypothetical protein C5D18_14900 [Rathayibacter tritici]
MKTFDASLHPRGHSSNVGAFTDREHTAPEATLARDWGVVNLEIGSRTPWGPADHVEHPAPGIAIADTPSHGGVKPSAARNRAIPAPLRRSGGWSEEDCEAHIVGMYFPDAFPRRSPESSRDGVIRWFPDAYEEVTGEMIEPGQSPVRDRAVWTVAHTDDLIIASASNDPDGTAQAIVTARRASDTHEAVFRVPKADYDSRRTTDEFGRDGRFIVDPTRYNAIPQNERRQPVPAVRYHSLPVGKTDAAGVAIARDLDRCWRIDDGRVRTLRQMLTEEGTSGRTFLVDNGKRRFYLDSRWTLAAVLPSSCRCRRPPGPASMRPLTRARAPRCSLRTVTWLSTRSKHSARTIPGTGTRSARLRAADEALRDHVALRHVEG